MSIMDMEPPPLFNPFNEREMRSLERGHWINQGLWGRAVKFYNNTRECDKDKLANCPAFYGKILKYIKSLPTLDELIKEGAVRQITEDLRNAYRQELNNVMTQNNK